MREYNGIESHISKLQEATKNIEVFISPAYDYVDGEYAPSLGIRDKENVGVCIDNIYWLIAGTAIYAHEEIRYMDLLLFMIDHESTYIDLRAQASIMGHLIQVDLGKRKIVSFEKDEATNRIFAKLEPRGD